VQLPYSHPRPMLQVKSPNNITISIIMIIIYQTVMQDERRDRQILMAMVMI